MATPMLGLKIFSSGSVGAFPVERFLDKANVISLYFFDDGDPNSGCLATLSGTSASEDNVNALKSIGFTISTTNSGAIWVDGDKSNPYCIKKDGKIWLAFNNGDSQILAYFIPEK